MTFLTRYRWYILSLIVGIIGYVVSYILFPLAFSILSINLTSNKDDIIVYAQELAKTQQFLPENFYSSVSFETDSQAKTFIEREYGSDVLSSIIENNLYQPYQWRVRHFVPDTITEQFFFITPDKKAYGFFTKIPDSDVSENISQKKAAKLALKSASSWNIDLTNYTLVAPSHQTLPSGRIDHTFIYERNDQSLDEGRYCVKIIVSGNQVSSVRQYIQVPESFEKKYQEERSLNNFLAVIAFFFMLFFCIFIGCGYGGFFLFKNNFLIVQPALRVGIIAGVIVFLNQINSLPLLWMSYQTTQSVTSFYSSQLSIALINALQTFGVFFFILMVAEGLTRKAFKTHPQFWSSWTDNGSNDITIQQTIIGYSATGFLLSFVVLFYFCTTRLFGWWIPVDTLINPNMLAAYVPCFSPIFSALSAGILEESLFRAIPLAGSVLLGRFYNKEKLFLSLGFIFQIIVFGAAHANYPAQPFYARLIELIVPSSLFGSIYLVFGLLPSIIAHSFYDLILMSLPLFVSDAKNIFLQQGAVILCGLIPIIISCYHRFKGDTNSLVILNQDWTKPTEIVSLKEDPHISSQAILSSCKAWICNIIGLASLFGILFLNYTIKLQEDEQIKKPFCIEIPEKRAIPFITNHSSNNYQYLQYRYIWQKSPQLYQDLMNEGFLHKPHWVTRYTQFHGPIAERTHEIYLFYKGQEIYRKKIIIPENKDLPSLDEEGALTIAYEKLDEAYTISKMDVTLIEKNSHKQVARLDWNFIFELKNKPHPEISQRIIITIAGNVVTDYAQYIFIPEPWIRENARQDNLFHNFILILWLLFLGILFVGFYKASQSIPFNSIDWRSIIIASCGLFIMGFLNFLNNWNISFANFLSIESITTQTIKLLLSTTIFLIIQSTFYAVVGFFCFRSYRPTYLWERNQFLHIKGLWNQFKSGCYLLPSLSASILSICLLFIVRSLTFTIAPFIPNLSYQQAYFPSFSLLYQALMTFFFFSFVLILTDFAIAFVTHEWRKNYFLGFLLSCITGAIISLNISFFASITVYSLTLYGIFWGTGFIIMYHLIMRYDRLSLLLIAQMLTIVALSSTLPLCYKWIVMYIVFFCVSIITTLK
jgi:hypothetical protein